VLLACSVIGESADDRGMLVFYAIQQAKTNSRRRGRGSSGVSGSTRCVLCCTFLMISIVFSRLFDHRVVNSSENRKNVLCENVEFCYAY